MKEEQTFNIEFKDILRVILKRYYLVLIITIPALLIGLYTGNSSIRVMYEVKAILIIGNNPNQNTQIQISDVSQVQPLIGTYCAVARTSVVSDKTIKRLNLNVSPESLKNNILATQQPGTPFIDLRLRWVNGLEAVTIMDALVDVYIQEAKTILPVYDIKVMEKEKSPQVIITSNKILYTAAGFSAGIIISLLLIFALEFMNTCFKSEDDVVSSLKLQVIGTIPKQRKNKKVKIITAETFGNFEYGLLETFRALRTNIRFAQVLKAVDSFTNTNCRPRVIVVTSGMPAEGKSTVASVLAALMARDNKRTVLIDCNLKNPDIHRIYNLNGKGLSSILTQGINWKSNIHKSEIENLYILPAENYLSNTAELFSSGNMKDLVDTLRSEFEYIILDTPSVNLFTDAQVLSPYVDGYLLVISFDKAKREDAIKAKTLIQYSKGKIIGVVLNKYSVSTTNMYYQRYSKAYRKIKGTSLDLKRRSKLVSSSNSDIKGEVASDTHF